LRVRDGWFRGFLVERDLRLPNPRILLTCRLTHQIIHPS
jgi:hypothetical protein